jgi:hypothetical protein
MTIEVLQRVRVYESYEVNWALERNQALETDCYSFYINKPSGQPNSPTDINYYKVLHMQRTYGLCKWREQTDLDIKSVSHLLIPFIGPMD